VVVELCAGVAPIACTVASAVARASVHAAEIDPVAAGYARRNHDGPVWLIKTPSIVLVGTAAR